jgi:serine/threonine-protein kinase RsbT
MEWEVLEAPGRRGLKLRFADEGPGIPNLELAMTDGWTSGTGLGMGLTGTKRSSTSSTSTPRWARAPA